MPTEDEPDARQPSPFSLVLAFALVYLAWGTTFLAVKIGVRAFPPALFSGARLGLAGAILLAVQGCRRGPFRLSGRDCFWIVASSLFLFLGGNFLMTTAQRSVDSGMAAVLTAATPLWMALLETLSPKGERLNRVGWLGMLVGPLGVVILLSPKLNPQAFVWNEAGPILIVVSAFFWAIGSFILRHRRPSVSSILVAAYQMFLGGVFLSLLGVAIGEPAQLHWENFTAGPIAAFAYLLIVGSLIGFVAYSWLLEYVPISLAGTYAYVNPVVAICVGGLLGGEEITLWTLVGMTVILGGVALVRSGRRPAPQTKPVPDDELPPLQAQPCETGRKTVLAACDASADRG